MACQRNEYRIAVNFLYCLINVIDNWKQEQPNDVYIQVDAKLQGELNYHLPFRKFKRN